MDLLSSRVRQSLSFRVNPSALPGVIDLTPNQVKNKNSEAPMFDNYSEVRHDIYFVTIYIITW